MKLNVEFKEGTNHAWLIGDESTELFVQRPFDALTVTNGELTCWIPSDMADEIRDDNEDDYRPDSVFVCCASDLKTEVYQVTEAVTFAGGSILLFLKQAVTIH